MKAKIARLMRNGKRDEAMALYDRYMTKRENKKKAFSPLPSLLDGAHRHCSNDDWESYLEYGFLPKYTRDYSDEEVEEFIDDYMRMVINSPYDCTGKLFTAWIDWHRNPTGLISYRHRISIDV